MCRVRIKNQGLLADFHFTVLDAASTLVHVEDSTGGRFLCVDKAEAARARAFAEQPLASAYNNWELPNAQRIDQVMLEQRLEEGAAAMDLNLATLFLGLEVRDLLGDVALQ